MAPFCRFIIKRKQLLEYKEEILIKTATKAFLAREEKRVG
jgi:hypothetical protein